MHMPMLKNRVNGCYGNHAFFHSANKFISMNKNISGVPMNNFAPIKIILEHKVGQISSRNTTVVFLCFFFSVFFIYVFINIHEYTN